MRRPAVPSHRTVARCFDCGLVIYFGSNEFPHINEVHGALQKLKWTNAEAPRHALAFENGMGTVWICPECSKKWADRKDLKLQPRWKPGDR